MGPGTDPASSGWPLHVTRRSASVEGSLEGSPARRAEAFLHKASAVMPDECKQNYAAFCRLVQAKYPQKNIGTPTRHQYKTFACTVHCGNRLGILRSAGLPAQTCLHSTSRMSASPPSGTRTLSARSLCLAHLTRPCAAVHAPSAPQGSSVSKSRMLHSVAVYPRAAHAPSPSAPSCCTFPMPSTPHRPAHCCICASQGSV